MSNDILQKIQSLQFHDKTEAEILLLTFLREVYSPQIKVVELRPSVLSLNSFNGFITLVDGRRLFFKSHTESDTIINEYYNTKQLIDIGYRVIEPVFSSTEVGKQVLIYDLILSPSVFDVAWEIENGRGELFPQLYAAQDEADKELFLIYLKSLHIQAAHDAEKAPIHQLFYHRLTGGRLERFYGRSDKDTDRLIQLPGRNYPIQSILHKQWLINGQKYSQSLASIIRRAVIALNPFQEGVSIIGHGDAHNGNVFFLQNEKKDSLLYFDPAFAGRHHPFLDLAKPLFHNVFAMWMYYPESISNRISIKLEAHDSILVVEHNYVLSEVRRMFLQSKIDNVLVPLLKFLKSQTLLPGNWREYLKMALFCCPLLTMNLSDMEKFSPEIALLGLTMAVEMGANSQEKHSYIDEVLDDVQRRI